MRFTSAFIPTLLSVPAVLAEYSAYAGYRIHTSIENWFVSVEADVVMPKLGWSCRALEEVAYIAVTLGNPLTCFEGQGFEAGVRFTCDVRAFQHQYEAYFRVYPGDVHLVDQVPIVVGEEIRMKLENIHGFLSVHLENLATGDTYWHDIGSVTIFTAPCISNAAWVLRADVNAAGSGLLPIPSFDQIDLNVKALDFLNQEYSVPVGPDPPGRLVMFDDSFGLVLWASPFPNVDSEDLSPIQSFRIEE